MIRCLALLFLFVASVSAKTCEWLGDSPACGDASCPVGWVELAKAGDISDSYLADFGDVCILGVKTLCCKKDAIKAKHNHHCSRSAHGCPNGKEKIAVERIAKFFFDNEYYNICCDREILKN